MTLEQDVPIFSKTKKDFTPSDKITHVAISNKQLAVAMANNMLFRMNLHNPQQHDGKTIVFVGEYYKHCFRNFFDQIHYNMPIN